MNYKEIMVNNWNDLLRFRNNFDLNWIFRGQPVDLPLSTSLERVITLFGIELKKAPKIENQLIRGFRRRYEGVDKQFVLSDTLYCLDIMQHYGAPTRLLDCTYSFLIASFFSIDKVKDEAVIWCINGNWLYKCVGKIIPSLLKMRLCDKTRNDTSFLKTYIKSKKKFIYAENPFLFHQRQIIQRGVFLCPSRIDFSFNRNLQAIPGWNSENNVLKLKIKINQRERKHALNDLSSMNISNATLFPGLDGFARSLVNELYYYEELADANTGK